MSIADAIREELELSGETLTSLCRRAGVGRQSVLNLLAGESCKVETLKRLEAVSGGRIGLHSMPAPELPVVGPVRPRGRPRKEQSARAEK